MVTEARAHYLHLDVGRRSPFATVVEAERDFQSIVSGVAHDLAGRDPFQWILENVFEERLLRFQITPDLTAKGANPELARDVVEAVAAGVEGLATSTNPPEHFSYDTLRAVQRLGSRRRELGHVAIRNGSHGGEIDGQLVLNLSEVLSPSFTEYGSIEGTLESLNIHKGNRYFRIYDVLTGRGVRCHFAKRIPIAEIRSAVDRRVAVGGEIDYRADGTPMECRAHDLSVFPPDSELPDFDSLRGLFN